MSIQAANAHRSTLLRMSAATLAGATFLAACQTSRAPAPPVVSPSSSSPACDVVGSQSGLLSVGDGSIAPVVIQPPSQPVAAPIEPSGGAKLVSVTPQNFDATQSEVSYVFGGQGVVGWTVAVVSSPMVYGGESAKVGVTGACTVQVSLTFDRTTHSGQRTGGATPSPDRLLPIGDRQGSIAEVVTYPINDGVSQYFIGVRSAESRIAVSQGTALTVRVVGTSPHGQDVTVRGPGGSTTP